MDLYEFEASLVCIGNSKSVETTWGRPCLKEKGKKKKKENPRDFTHMYGFPTTWLIKVIPITTTR